VIIGQDPYPNIGEVYLLLTKAMGLCFSIKRGIKIPKSLVKIYEGLSVDKKLNFKAPKHGDLTKWAEQGVLLLNATLTVEHKKPNSHQKESGWNDFTNYVIKQISTQKKGVVFLLWGGFAKKMKKLIDEKKHHVIENIHPSPLGAMGGGNFADSDQFSKTNELLKKEGKEPIDWNCD
jgi:uracil-DNA glycosylase